MFYLVWKSLSEPLTSKSLRQIAAFAQLSKSVLTASFSVTSNGSVLWKVTLNARDSTLKKC